MTTSYDDVCYTMLASDDLRAPNSGDIRAAAVELERTAGSGPHVANGSKSAVVAAIMGR